LTNYRGVGDKIIKPKMHGERVNKGKMQATPLKCLSLEDQNVVTLLESLPKWVTSLKNHTQGARTGVRARFKQCACTKDDVTVCFTKERATSTQVLKHQK
jgi:hypothetical protein